MKSIKNIYKIGYGPSSSHTMGPAFATSRFMGENPNAPQDMTDTDDVIAGNCTHTEDCDCIGNEEVSTDDESNGTKYTPDSSWGQFETSNDEEKIGVGFDDATRGDQP